MGGVTEASTQLVFAIGHEVGNHLGGVRLQAHLLDDELDARSLAEASVVIDDLAGRSGALLQLIRPLLSESWREVRESHWADVLARVREHVEQTGTRGTRFEVAVPEEAAVGAPGHDWIHALLCALVDVTLAGLDRDRTLSLSLVVSKDQSVLRLEDDGEAEDLSEQAATRGRPLVVAIGRELLGRIGGHVRGGRDAERTRLELVFPGAERRVGATTADD